MRKKLLTILVLALSTAGVFAAKASDHRHWSVDLDKYGYHGPRAEAGRSSASLIRVAATAEVVAAAVANFASVGKNDEHHQDWHAPMEVNALFFDADTGKLKEKRGPWNSDCSFELSPTSRGNFLLLLRHYDPSGESTGESLYLLSPSGEELAKRELPPIPRESKSRSYEVLRSTSRSTSLLKWFDGEVFHYQILDANTLQTQLEWTESNGAPFVIALSDHELLGFLGPHESQERSATKGKYDLFVRATGGPWRPLPVPFDVRHSGLAPRGSFVPSFTAFLSDHLLGGVVSGEDAARVLKIVQTDGTIVFSQKIDDEGVMTVSPNGQYLGFVYVSLSAFDRWVERTTDMQFWPHPTVLSVWRTSHPAPVAKLTLGRDIGDYCFSADGSQFAYMDGGTLKAIPVPVTPATAISQVN